MTDTEFVEKIKEYKTMRQAAESMGFLSFSTFKRRAKKLGVYSPNQGGGPKYRVDGRGKFPLKDILDGKHPKYGTSKITIRLIQENIKPRRCESCGLETWLDKPIPIETHHIDGNKHNHKLENLQLLCPNCHSFTDNFTSKNIKRKRTAP